jgi:hypothetical protein
MESAIHLSQIELLRAFAGLWRGARSFIQSLYPYRKYYIPINYFFIDKAHFVFRPVLSVV